MGRRRVGRRNAYRASMTRMGRPSQRARERCPGAPSVPPASGNKCRGFRIGQGEGISFNVFRKGVLMAHSIDRREFLKLAGLGGVVLVSGSSGFARGESANAGDFYFVQLSDAHWGFEGPAQNPDATGTLRKAIAAVNALKEPPDFVVFTGDLTHTTEDGKVRRKRMDEVKSI